MHGPIAAIQSATKDSTLEMFRGECRHRALSRNCGLSLRNRAKPVSNVELFDRPIRHNRTTKSGQLFWPVVRENDSGR